MDSKNYSTVLNVEHPTLEFYVFWNWRTFPMLTIHICFGNVPAFSPISLLLTSPPLLPPFLSASPLSLTFPLITQIEELSPSCVLAGVCLPAVPVTVE